MTQKDAIKKMLSGANVFLTGAPGAGKTYTLNKFIEKAEAKGKSVAITASTGIAASHIGGITIHSFSGLGIEESVTEELLDKVKRNKRVVKRYKNTDVLVIDEVSMLHGNRLDMIDFVARQIRKDPRPFGGMQVILVGDLFQLPPVNRNSAEVDFIFYSKTWKKLDLEICYITEQHRQDEDDLLLDILQAMRKNKIEKHHKQALNTRSSQSVSDDKLTRLYSHNVDVDAINEEKLRALSGKSRHWRMHKEGDRYKLESLIKGVLAPEDLELRVGAEVMFVANNFEVGFVNGTRGTVVGFHKKSGHPIVKIESGRKIRVERHSWKMKEDDRVIAEVEQIPLRLAWAITIHKSQGMSLDAAIVDLSKAFTPGMGYVALSRVRSLQGLYLSGINDLALVMHKEIYALDELLLEKSESSK